MTKIFLFIIVHWYLSLFCQTFFLHRYGAHQMFTMPLFWERFFYVLTFLTQGASYLNPRAYALLHRKHHAYSDTEKDPHSPRHSKSLGSMMLKTFHIYTGYRNREIAADSKVEQNCLEWPVFDRLTASRMYRLLFLAIYVSIYAVLQAPLWMYIFIPLHMLVGPIQGAMVNWWGHKYGYVNFDNQDDSRNTLAVDFLCMGELMQNNHHQDTKKVNFASKWFEIDLAYPFILLLRALGIIRFTPAVKTPGKT